LIWRIASFAKYPAESGAVQQQPAFDVRVGDGKHHWRKRGGNRFGGIVNFSRASVQPSAVGVCGYDNQIWQRAALSRQISHICAKLIHNPAVPFLSAYPIQLHWDTVAGSQPERQPADNQLVSKVFDKQSNLTHQSPL
jgi:hypothetical protein